MANHQDIHQAKVNGSGSYQYNTGETTTVRQLVMLLAKSSEANRHTAIRRSSNFLLKKMAKNKWRIKAGAHRGGFGGKGSSPDNTNR